MMFMLIITIKNIIKQLEEFIKIQKMELLQFVEITILQHLHLLHVLKMTRLHKQFIFVNLFRINKNKKGNEGDELW